MPTGCYASRLGHQLITETREKLNVPCLKTTKKVWLQYVIQNEDTGTGI
jgi:hypothetical protein